MTAQTGQPEARRSVKNTSDVSGGPRKVLSEVDGSSTRPPNEQELSGRHTAAQRAAVPVRWSVWLGVGLRVVTQTLGEFLAAPRAEAKEDIRYKKSRHRER